MPRTTHGACSQTPENGCAAEMHGEVTCSGCPCVPRDFLRKTNHEPLLAMTRSRTRGVHRWTLSLPESVLTAPLTLLAGSYRSLHCPQVLRRRVEEARQHPCSRLNFCPVALLRLHCPLHKAVFPAVSVLTLAQPLWSPLSSYKTTTAIATSTWRPG